MKYPVIAIWAEHVNPNGETIIGLNGGLPTRNTQDLEFFKQVTEHSVCIVGRETLDTLPVSGLPGRELVVLTRDLSRAYGNNPYPIFNDYGRNVEEVLQVAEELVDELNKSGEEVQQRIYVIGGKQTYEQLMPHTDAIIRSTLFTDFTVNETAVLPPQGWEGFRLVDIRTRDEGDGVQVFTRPSWRNKFEAFVKGAFDATS